MSLKSTTQLLLACALSLALPIRALEPKPAGIDVILWFDTEDYLLPADDDAAKRLCEMLSQRNIRATFKVVGEKARVLERRKRTDVIDALKKHDIGYHANFHSVHPTPSEYLAECGLLDGIAEFARREGGGAADVRRVFGVETLSCYGQPGSSWGSQAIAALKQIGVAPHGVPCYVDEGTHIGLDAKPFWYTGALVVYHMRGNRTRMDLHDPAAVEPAKEKVSAIAERLRKEGGGLISIYYHPCEWVHREFWDGVNFSRGANPDRALWRAPAQRTEAETEAAFERFGKYIDHIKAIPGVRFVTATDLPELYPDRAEQNTATAAELDEIAARLLDEKTTGVDFIQIGDKTYSAADQFKLLLTAVNLLNQWGKTNFPLNAADTIGLLGPDSAPPPHVAETHLDWPAFRNALRDASEYVQSSRRVPSRIFIGATPVPPADFMSALASAYAQGRKLGATPAKEGVALRALELLPAKHVAEDTDKLFGGWVIHKEGFRAPKILDVARLQTWTLKPAVRAK